MSSEFLAITEMCMFVILVASYFYVVTRKTESKLLKIKEVALLYSTTFMFAISKTISSVLFLLTAISILIFNLNKAKVKRNERRIKGGIN
jgi:predicted membrane protein